MKWIERLLLFGNIVLVILTVFAYLSPYINPEKASVFALFGLAFPILMFCNVVFIIIWINLKYRYASLSAVCMLIGVFPITNIVTASFTSTTFPKDAIKIASYNMQFSKPLLGAKNRVNAHKKSQLSSFLKSDLNVDILCGQEIGKVSRTIIQEALNFPYEHRHSKYTCSIFSKYPFVNRGMIAFNSKIHVALWADVVAHGDTIRIYTAHLQANSTDGVEPAKVETKAPEPKMQVLGAFAMTKNYALTTNKRIAQAKMIREHQSKCPYPSIITGDFNDPPQSHLYHVISDDLNDTFTDEGTGIGSTYGGKIPGLRIDYILPDPAFEVLNHNTYKKDYSDHYPIMAVLKI